MAQGNRAAVVAGSRGWRDLLRGRGAQRDETNEAIIVKVSIHVVLAVGHEHTMAVRTRRTVKRAARTGKKVSPKAARKAARKVAYRKQKK